MAFVRHKGRRQAKNSVAGGDPRFWDGLVEVWAREEGIEEKLRNHPDWRLIQQYIRPPARVLEAGCGYAKWVWFLQQQGFEACGIDFSEAAISQSRARWPELRLQRGLIQDMPYEDGFFDAIVSFGAIEHMEAGPQAMLAEMRRVLAPGGVLYCTVPCYSIFRRAGPGWLAEFLECNPLIRSLRHLPPEVEFWQYRWTPREYADILDAAGFDVIDIRPVPPAEKPFGQRTATLQRRIVARINRRWPWFMPHMMAGICRKPKAGAAADSPL